MNLTVEEKEIYAEKNYSYIHYFAKKYYSPQWNYEDLVGAASLGMTKALNTFNKDKAIKFSTYAAKCIINAIFMFMRKEKKHLNNISIDQPITTDKDGQELTILDTLAMPEDELDWREITPVVNLVLGKLKERDKKIMFLFFENVNQSDIGRKIGLSQTYVSRIIKKVLKEIKKEYWRGEEGVTKLHITADEFVSLRYVKKMPITQIAQMKGVSDATIHYWKNNNAQAIQQLRKAFKEPDEKVTQTITQNADDTTVDYQNEIDELKEQLKNRDVQLKEQQRLNDQLQRKIINTPVETAAKPIGCDTQIKELSAKLTDAENEIARLREANDKLQGEKNGLITDKYHLDYRVSNQEERIKTIGKTLETLTIENRHLKGLVKLWME